MTGHAWVDWPERLLVVAPHFDDELLGCGRLMRNVQAAGGLVVVVWMTDGGASHGDPDASRRQELVARRRVEVVEGLREFGVIPTASFFWDHPDGGLGGVNPISLLNQLQDLCDAHAIDTVVVTDGDDGHPDHRAAFAIARLLNVKRVFSFPISTRFDGKPYTPPSGAFLIDPERNDDKQAALGKHRSQLEAGGAIYPLTRATIRRFCLEPEVFIPVSRGMP